MPLGHVRNPEYSHETQENIQFAHNKARRFNSRTFLLLYSILNQHTIVDLLYRHWDIGFGEVVLIMLMFSIDPPIHCQPLV